MLQLECWQILEFNPLLFGFDTANINGGGEKGEEMGRRAATEMESRPVRVVLCLPDLLKVLERPIYKTAAVPDSEQGEYSRP